MQRLRRAAAAQARGLLRVLLLRLGAVSADSGGARQRRGFNLLRRKSVMTNLTVHSSADWVANKRTYLLAWWLPHAGLIAGLFVVVPARTAIWTIALAWMGMACLLNARRCGRTHCRYTGPYYLAAIVPVLVLGFGFIAANFYGWIALGAVIVTGSKVIWWATERAWGRFS